MQAVILKCPQRAQFHFGKIALDVDTSLDDTSVILHSDTIFSAIITTIAKISEHDAKEEKTLGPEDFIEFFENDQIRISSGFHCLELADARFIYFLPKPIHFNLDKSENNEDRKQQSRIRFISKKVWEMGLGPKEWADCTIFQNRYVVHNSELVSIDGFNTERMKIYEIHSLPKVSIHKPTKEDSIYFQTNLMLADNRHLISKKGKTIKQLASLKAQLPGIHYYFLLNDHNLPGGSTGKAAKKLRAAIRVLADTGIGGERSVGCGRLDGVAFNDFDLEVGQNKYWCSMSLINPNGLAEQQQLQRWKMITRGGRRIPKSQVITQEKLPLDYTPKLQRVKMVAEGALLGDDIGGRIVPIPVEDKKHETTSHHVRSGKGMSLPIHPNVYP
ncbi:MAG: hypothetical protein AAFZ15_24155 [Bacteroidota bacterium]